tara:strand:+ start:635 stop:1534 length:900 start_codon:yes stop_codon:yes gene_type:complete
MRVKNPSDIISQPKILLYCFVVGFFIWLFNELNNRSDATILYPIDFKYEDNDELFVVDAPPKFIDISINGTGWNLLRNLLKLNIKSAEYNINKPTQTKFILSSSLFPNISQSLEGVNLNYVVTDSILFNIELKSNRSLKIIVDTSDISFRDNFERVGNLLTSHNEIKVEGPQSIIKSLDDEYIVKIEDQNIDSDYDEEIKIEDLDKFLTPNPDIINLSFKVSEFINEEVSLNAYYVDDNFTIDTIIVVSYKIKKGDELTNADSLYINFIKESDVIIPEIVGPQKIKILDISPNSFILDK